MTDTPWKGLVSGLLFSVQYETDLGDDLAERRARAMLEEPLPGFGQDDGYAALAAALASPDDLAGLLPGPIPAGHTDADLRAFVTRVRDHMDAKRPWTPPAYLPIDTSRSGEFTHGHPIAALPPRWVEVGERLQRMFTAVDAAGGEQEILLLRLRTGDEIALVAPWWERSEQVAVVQHPRSDRNPREVLTAFLDLTGYARHEITDLTTDHT